MQPYNNEHYLTMNCKATVFTITEGVQIRLDESVKYIVVQKKNRHDELIDLFHHRLPIFTSCLLLSFFL